MLPATCTDMGWKSKRVRYCVLAGYCLMLIGLSSIPSQAMPNSQVLNYDKVLHALVYAGLGFLLASTQWPWFVALIIGILAGGLDELYQNVTPGRMPSLSDWVADSFGVAMGILVYRIFLHVTKLHSRGRKEKAR
ncbi:MAG: VanZ family protein [Verrucomicrobiota bacterium]